MNPKQLTRRRLNSRALEHIALIAHRRNRMIVGIKAIDVLNWEDVIGIRWSCPVHRYRRRVFLDEDRIIQASHRPRGGWSDVDSPVSSKADLATRNEIELRTIPNGRAIGNVAQVFQPIRCGLLTVHDARDENAVGLTVIAD